MKTILVATDFSNASREAAKYGVALASAFNARVVLFNAYGPISGAGDETSVHPGKFIPEQYSILKKSCRH